MLRQAIPVLHISSSSAAEDFYCQQLGFHLEFRVPADPGRPDPCYLGLGRDSALLHLSSHAGDGVLGGVVYVIVEDVDALHEEFATRGTPIHVAPVNQTWGMREMYVRDPDGNSVRFGCPFRPERVTDSHATRSLTSLAESGSGPATGAASM